MLTIAHFPMITFAHLLARAERFELPSTVLETAILPLNYARILLRTSSTVLDPEASVPKFREHSVIESLLKLRATSG